MKTTKNQTLHFLPFGFVQETPTSLWGPTTCGLELVNQPNAGTDVPSKVTCKKCKQSQVFKDANP